MKQGIKRATPGLHGLIEGKRRSDCMDTKAIQSFKHSHWIWFSKALALWNFQDAFKRTNEHALQIITTLTGASLRHLSFICRTINLNSRGNVA